MSPRNSENEHHTLWQKRQYNRVGREPRRLRMHYAMRHMMPIPEHNELHANKVLDKSLDSQDERLSQDTAKFVAKTDVEFSEKVDPESTKPQTLLVRFIGDVNVNVQDK